MPQREVFVYGNTGDGSRSSFFQARPSLYGRFSALWSAELKIKCANNSCLVLECSFISFKMPKKKTPKNAFYFFMLDFRVREENRGRKFPGGMKEVAEKAASEWSNMTSAQKKPFEEKAKLEKERDKTDLNNKFTTQGKSYAELERERNVYLQEYNQMIQEIETTVQSRSQGDLSHHSFHIINLNFFCRQENGTYTPCEIAIAEFSLNEGILKTYHTLINPGDIPLGYNHEARMLSSSEHQIPVPPEEYGGEKDYHKIFENIKHFVAQNPRAVRPFYAFSTDVDVAKNVLMKLQDDFSDILDFRVYPLSKLFFELRKAAVGDKSNLAFKTESIAQQVLSKDVWCHERGFACSFHEPTEALQYCSLHRVNRYAFYILDHCCQYLGIDIIPGKHVPKKADTFGSQKAASRPGSVLGDVPSRPPSAISSVASGSSKSLEPARLPKSLPDFLGAMGVTKMKDELPVVVGRGRGARHLCSDFKQLNVD